MSTNVTVRFNASADQVLPCAYKALLSFKKPKDYYIEAIAFAAFADVEYEKMRDRVACLITALPISDSLCNLTIHTDRMGSVACHSLIEGWHIHFTGELIKRTIENLSPDT